MKRPKVLILGAGFGGVSAFTTLSPRDFEVTLCSPRNHFLFTPLLTGSTVGTVEFRSIIEPVRRADSRHAFYQAEATRIDPEQRRVELHWVDHQETFSLPFDHLIIAVGAAPSTFGIPGVIEHAHFLKEVSDGRAVRQAILARLEHASLPSLSDIRRRELVRFVVVGGGATGVEFAAELHDFLQEAESWFPVCAPEARILLLEATGEILPGFDEALKDYAEQHFQRERIELLKDSPVREVRAGEVELQNGQRIACGLIVWTTGIRPLPFIEALPFAKDGRGRLIVDPFLQVSDHPGIYAVGDCASIEGANLPATAQVAQRQGAHLADSLRRRRRGREPEPFAARTLGMLAYIGGKKALADLPQVKGRGVSAWLLWRSVYITKLVSLKNKILVLFDWLKAAVFGRDICRF